MEFLFTWILIGVTCFVMDLMVTMAVGEKPPSSKHMLITFFAWPYWVWLVLVEFMETLK